MYNNSDEETDCSKCVHNDVCDKKMSKRCINYEYGNDQPYIHDECDGCIHRFDRHNLVDSRPCFICEDFLSREGR